MKRYLIAVEGLTSENEARLRRYLNSNGEWWHWVANVWLLSTPDSSSLTASSISNCLDELGRTKYLVLEVLTDGDHVTKGPRAENGARMGDWLRAVWKKEEQLLKLPSKDRAPSE